ncbi:hypothetical protein MHC_01875 [Mycoplasma haemocanis str. Illinois]|uniref:Uncharacterized protein n=1 Tax=Mycoplasma haemocanis (strain Illinois) TaxID=1111676 RepID=H6N6G9_MYCHN|nr:hypothetical protein [Mycoplasma haemocanis]AEW45241.1 hypothetical protein MHC_01875 [Mycoplasma haemocanis str. Illinois]
MSIAPKIALGALSVGGIAGGGVLISQNLSKETISDKLKGEGYTILTDDSHEEWNTVLTKFKEGSINLPKFSLTNQELKTLQSKCKEVLSKSNFDEDDYKKSKKWCVKPTSIKEVLGKRGIQSLNFETNSERDKDSWIKMATKYVIHGTGNKKIGNFTISPTPKDTGWSQLKAQCKTLIEKDSWWNSDFEDELTKAKLWCTKSSDYLAK